MPGLSQLKQFNADILDVGDETRIRGLRGEKPVRVPIPNTVQDINDAEDFVLGLPEDTDEQSASTSDSISASNDINIDGDDFSSGGGLTADEIIAQAGGNDLDMSSLLNPVAASDSDIQGMPDLSMFDEPVAESPADDVASVSPLDDLEADDLFSNSNNDTAASDFDLDNLEPLDFSADDFSTEEPSAGEPPLSTDDFSLDNTADNSTVTDSSNTADSVNLDDFSLDDLSFDAPDNSEVVSESAPMETPVTETSAVETPSVEDAASETSDDTSGISTNDANDDFAYSGGAIDMTEDLPDEITERNEVPQNITSEQAADASADFSVADASATDFSSLDDNNLSDASSDFDLDGLEDNGSALDAGATDKNNDLGDELSATPSPDDSKSDDFNLGDLDLPDFNDTAESSDSSNDSPASTDSNDAEVPSFSESESTSDFGMSFDDTASVPSDDTPPAASDETETPAATASDGLGLDLDGLGLDSNAPVETFDTSDMEGLDFSTSISDGGDFSLASSDELSDEMNAFEIPGFSDTDTAPDAKAVKPVSVQTQGKDEDAEADDNTLTDAQYEKFLKNLSGYPLNVRLAVEDLLVKNEFTDDAEFAVVKKIVNKVPARQLAGYLEKMLDISLPVPRDFERRSASEYEAFKASFQYQLKNRIIPALLVGIVAVLLIFGLIQFSYRLIYKPLKANSLYAQGYSLIVSNDYPQSEILFEEATDYDIQKKWFYRYAQEYRKHKQYDRAEKMYRLILNRFNHEKQAGLEFADMEFMDRANYEKAEHIIRREVLDYHVNDTDALLALGDVYLEWATERDPEKFENARLQYATLIEINGKSRALMDVYMSRMMRYFVRTDNLRETLMVKEYFMAGKAKMSAADWTELSGYLFDKQYGPLSPSDEYLRRSIEDVRAMLGKAVDGDPTNPIALYNMARYYIQLKNNVASVSFLNRAASAFKNATTLKTRDMYKYIDTYRLLGEQYVDSGEYLLARETYTDGIALYQNVHDMSGLSGNANIGKLFADMGDMDYFISGDNDNAYRNYLESVNLGNDTASIRYRLGYIQYGRQDYDAALNSFLRASDVNPDDNNLLLALGNTLAMRGNNYAAEGYYSRLMEQLDKLRAQRGILLPQVRDEEADIVEMILRASNNYGVTLYNVAGRTGSSAKNAEAMVQLSLSMRAWDALTRNQVTMIRIGGSNLAEQNMRYMTRSYATFEPAIYTDLWRTLVGEDDLS